MKAFAEEDMEIALLWVATVALAVTYTTTPSILSKRVITRSPSVSFKRINRNTERFMLIILWFAIGQIVCL